MGFRKQNLRNYTIKEFLILNTISIENINNKIINLQTHLSEEIK